jgi:hypothetical protein
MSKLEGVDTFVGTFETWHDEMQSFIFASLPGGLELLLRLKELLAPERALQTLSLESSDIMFLLALLAARYSRLRIWIHEVQITTSSCHS